MDDRVDVAAPAPHPDRVELCRLSCLSLRRPLRVSRKFLSGRRDHRLRLSVYEYTPPF